mmetsp:Transcript_77300/g.224256  ORF Transcript_77300/g.224256 Transcript_77300/m.224256 type:complete len:260 (-) Transcript_77300:1238-2017(-)
MVRREESWLCGANSCPWLACPAGVLLPKAFVLAMLCIRLVSPRLAGETSALVLLTAALLRKAEAWRRCCKICSSLEDMPLLRPLNDLEDSASNFLHKLLSFSANLLRGVGSLPSSTFPAAGVPPLGRGRGGAACDGVPMGQTPLPLRSVEDTASRRSPSVVTTPVSAASSHSAEIPAISAAVACAAAGGPGPVAACRRRARTSSSAFAALASACRKRSTTEASLSATSCADERFCSCNRAITRSASASRPVVATISALA